MLPTSRQLDSHPMTIRPENKPHPIADFIEQWIVHCHWAAENHSRSWLAFDDFLLDGFSEERHGSAAVIVRGEDLEGV